MRETRKALVLVFKDTSRTRIGKGMVQVRLPKREERRAHAPWWLASGDLTEQSRQDRPREKTKVPLVPFPLKARTLTSHTSADSSLFFTVRAT